jgi:hypothetical protein
MTSRRRFITSALTLPAIGRALAGAIPCKSSRYNHTAFDNLRLPETVNNTFQRETGTPARRPLWSKLAQDPAALQRYVDTFGTAYRKMLTLPPTDRCSMTYQAGLHYYHCYQPVPAVPPSARYPQIHGSSAFLPWHRAYLYYFERVVQSLSNAPHFRLAAWDWEVNKNVPAAYNHWVTVAGMQGCQIVRDNGVAEVADPTGWLLSASSVDFQGSQYGTGNSMDGPHDTVHRSIGDFMHRIEFSALDPIFSAHHANIDRFWEAWYQHYKDVPHFFDNQTWPSVPSQWIFYDAKIQDFVSVKPCDMLDLTGLGYDYELPRTVLFEYLSLSGTPLKNMIRFHPADVDKFTKSLNDALNDALKLLNPVALLGVVAHLNLKDLAAKLETAAVNFRLPVVVGLRVPPNALPGDYRLSLKSGLRSVVLGPFAVLSGHHHQQTITSFGSIGYKDLDIFDHVPVNGFQIACDAKFFQPEFLSFELRYPRNLKAWKKIVRP